jgi:hypothetical protein
MVSTAPHFSKPSSVKYRVARVLSQPNSRLCRHGPLLDQAYLSFTLMDLATGATPLQILPSEEICKVTPRLDCVFAQVMLQYV